MVHIFDPVIYLYKHSLTVARIVTIFLHYFFVTSNIYILIPIVIFKKCSVRYF